jgi:hypothetical protein
MLSEVEKVSINCLRIHINMFIGLHLEAIHLLDIVFQRDRFCGRTKHMQRIPEYYHDTEQKFWEELIIDFLLIRHGSHKF